MRTITIDDRQSVVNMLLRILKEIDPEGEHIGTTDPDAVLDSVREKETTVIFMDVEMPKKNGIVLAKEIQAIDPEANIIFITGYKEYMPDAFGLYASGYLLKPIAKSEVINALSHLRYRKDEKKEEKIKVQCFGNFEVFVRGEPMFFHRTKSKELFAYLVDRQGAVCSNDMIIGNLWPDKLLTDSLKSLERTVVSEMIRDFEEAGVTGLFLKAKNGISVKTEMLDCDYYQYLDGNEKAIRRFKGEYMTQYEFAQETRENLLRNY